jgi:hypothetical protein
MPIGTSTMKEKDNYDRGKIAIVKLKSPIVFNGNSITEAIIEIDHINFGLNIKTAKLNTKRRSNFSVDQVIRFLELLHGEDMYPKYHRKRYSHFEHRVTCPIPGKYFRKQFFMVFETNYDKPEQIHSITLFLKD